MTKPSIDDIEYEYNADAVEVLFDEFESPEALVCNYVWSYTAMLADGSDLPDDLITFDASALAFEISAASGVAQVLEVVLRGELDNEKTAETVEFQVEYILAAAPYYFIEEAASSESDPSESGPSESGHSIHTHWQASPIPLSMFAAMAPELAGGQFTISGFYDRSQVGIALDSSQTTIEVPPQIEPGNYTVTFVLEDAAAAITSTFTVEIEVKGDAGDAVGESNS